jgi:hypothetical protein
MTTLTNPTDAELNEAFAVHVKGLDAGIYQYLKGRGEEPDGLNSIYQVLPHLDACRDVRVLGGGRQGWWTVIVYFKESGRNAVQAEARDLARACVLALLKAHGVEVVYVR